MKDPAALVVLYDSMSRTFSLQPHHLMGVTSALAVTREESRRSAVYNERVRTPWPRCRRKILLTMKKKVGSVLPSP